MKVVIDIPDDWERRIKCNIRPNTIECGELVESIWKGKMLPKGHGDLIDRNNLLYWSYEIVSRYCEFDKVVSVDNIKDAPTIIEADKEVDQNDN